MARHPPNGADVTELAFELPANNFEITTHGNYELLTFEEPFSTNRDGWQLMWTVSTQACLWLKHLKPGNIRLQPGFGGVGHLFMVLAPRGAECAGRCESFCWMCSSYSLVNLSSTGRNMSAQFVANTLTIVQCSKSGVNFNTGFRGVQQIFLLFGNIELRFI